MKRWRKRVVYAVAVAVLIVLIGTAVLVVSGLNDDLGKADAALVLGSKVELDGTPSPRLRARLDRALELHGQGYFRKIITSGGTGVEGRDEAMVMRDYLVARGVPKADVIVDSGGATTFASAKNARAIAGQQGFRSIFVVTQHFHIPRTRLALRRFGIADVRSASARYYEARDLYSSFREFFGYLSYLLKSYDAADPARGNPLARPPS